MQVSSSGLERAGDDLFPAKAEIEPRFPSLGELETAKGESARFLLGSLLLKAAEEGCSDVHISGGERVFVRRNRTLSYLSEEPLSTSAAETLSMSVLTEEQVTLFLDSPDLDFALELPGGNRFRVNVMQHNRGVGATFHIVPAKLRTLDSLGFDATALVTLEKLLTYHNGLILVTGPVGSGKTVTLAAMMEQINLHRQDHIITVEDPIEIVLHSGKSQVSQRGVRFHTESFRRALKGALRQDPDVIVIGEMRDLETIEMAITASETGHLVIGTMHTSDAATTLNRVLDVFPPEQQPQIRAMVAESLRGIVCQRLLPTVDDQMALAYEILLRNPAVSAMIREGKAQGLGNVIETSRREGMQLMDTSVFELWKAGRISDQTALQELRGEPLRQQVLARQRAAELPAAPTPGQSEPEDGNGEKPVGKKKRFWK